MNKLKRFLAVVLALALTMTLVGSAMAEAQNVAPFRTTDTVDVTVDQIMANDVVSFYKLGTPQVDEHNQMTITWVNDAIATLLNGKTTEAWNYAPDAAIQSGLAALIANDTITLSSLTKTDSEPATGTSVTTALAPGYYLALVRQGAASLAANVIYQNMLINAIPQANSATGTWAAHEEITAHVKKTTEDITKEQREAGAAVDTWTAETVDGYKRGDFIPFKITTHIPSYPANSLYATFEITDTPTGLRFVNDTTHPLALKVGTTDVTTNATATVNTDAENETFKITVADNSLVVTFDKEYILEHPGSAVELTYWAELIAEENVSHNHATIEYNRNPDESTTQKPFDEVGEKTYGFTLLKYKQGDTNKNPLVGASFTLWDAATDGNKIQVIYDASIEIKKADGTTTTVAGYRPIKAGETADEYIVASDGTASVYCLGDQNYYLQEDIAPANFTRMDGRQVIHPTEETSVQGIDVEIPNTEGVTLPETGGIGTTIFYVAGIVLVLGAAAIIVARRKAEQN